MKYSKIFCTMYAINILSIDDTTSNFNKELIADIFFPLETEISLDFLKLQIKKNQIDLQNDWNGLQSKIIIKKAESIVKASSKDLIEKIKEKIIGYFEEIDITIFFTQDNMIVKDDSSQDSDSLLFEKKNQEEDEQKLIEEQIIAQEKYKELHPETTVHKNAKHKKIHGARRTMKRLKKRYANEAKEKKEHHKELLEAVHAHLKEKPSKKSSSQRSTNSYSSTDSKPENYDKKESPRNITPQVRPSKHPLKQDQGSDPYKFFEPVEG